MNPQRKAVLLGLPVALFLLVVGSLMTVTDPETGVRYLGVTIALVGVLGLGALSTLLLPRSAVVPRRDGPTTVLDGSPMPQRLLGLTAVVLTLMALTSLRAVTDPTVKGMGLGTGRPGRSELVLLVAWPLAAWAWYTFARGRNRQSLEITDDCVVLQQGRRRLERRTTRAEVAVGVGTPAQRQTVRVGGEVPEDEIVVGAPHFATTPESLAAAIRDALPR